MAECLRIVVTGLAASYPFGGVFWDYLQYPLGFHRLGHDVLYLEDTGRWVYDPVLQTFTESGRTNAELLAKLIVKLEPALKDRWYVRDAAGNTFGKSPGEVAEFCRSADLFIHVSASCWMREEYFAAKRVVFIDSDPIYTQSAVPHYVDGTVNDLARSQVDMLRRHHVHFTFAENIGAPDCRVPTELFNWFPTRQPIVLDQFARQIPIDSRRRMLTTVASWEPSEKGPTVNGVTYCGKSVEFRKFMELARRSALPLEIAISGAVPRDELRAMGWNLREGFEISGDPWTYRDYLANSFGEWSVAKNAYVASRSGWFSCRSACYLALGVPVIVQDTGFTPYIPSGDGVIAFTNLDEAAAAIERLLSNPIHHSKAAVEMAREYFDSTRVLTQLIEHSLA